MSNAGRPTDYDPKYCQMIIEYFEKPLAQRVNNKVEANDLPQLTAFARSIGVSRGTLFNWKNQFPEFLDAYNTATQLQEEMLVGNSLQNRYNPYFAQFMLKNCHGWKDKQEVEQTVNQIKITKEDEDL